MSDERTNSVSPEQMRYARILDFGMKAGLAVLAAGFGAYVTGALPLSVALEDLPRLWALPVDEYLRASGAGAGWPALAEMKGETLALAGIVLLAGISLPCLAALLPEYARRGDRIYLAVVAGLIGVLLAAASGLIGSH